MGQQDPYQVQQGENAEFCTWGGTTPRTSMCWGPTVWKAALQEGSMEILVETKLNMEEKAVLRLLPKTVKTQKPRKTQFKPLLTILTILYPSYIPLVRLFTYKILTHTIVTSCHQSLQKPVLNLSLTHNPMYQKCNNLNAILSLFLTYCSYVRHSSLSVFVR